MTESVNECPVCNSKNIGYWEDLDTWICENCSYVINEDSPEIPTTSSCGTSSDDVENTTWDQALSITDKSEANLVELLSQVEEVSNTLSLPDELMLRAGEISAEAWETNFMHGRTTADTVGAAVYAAGRELQYGVPPASIASAVDRDKQSIKTTYQKLRSNLHLDVAPPQPVDYIDYLCQVLNLSEEIAETAERLLTNHRIGGNPVGIAAAGVYLAADQEADLTLREVAEVIGLTKETVWRQTKRIQKETKADSPSHRGRG